MAYHLPLRLSRLRQTQSMRNLLDDIRLDIKDFVLPIFVSEKITAKKPIMSMPGLYQWPVQALEEEIESIVSLGIQSIILFGIPATKDATGSCAYQDEGIVQQALRKIRQIDKNLLVIADLCMCEYTSHGHCGVLKDASIDIDNTLNLLSKQAISLAEAGADWLAPSGMIDGMVQAIRQALDAAGFHDKAILSYAVKYASHLYGPFREASEGGLQFGDRRSHQLSFANRFEALREAELDIKEGADLIMVKPAILYLDIIYQLKQKFPSIPLGAYQVSGEYAFIKSAQTLGLQEREVLLESLIAIKRAGADFIISYFTKELAMILNARGAI